MAARYWVLGTGSWDAVTTTNWSTTSGGSGGASVPGTSDAVIFDSNSGGGTTTITADQSVASITWTSFAGTLDTNGFTLTISGTFNLGTTTTRVLTLGSSTINVGTWTGPSNITGLTVNKGTSTINVTAAGTFSGSLMSLNIVNITPPANSTITITTSCVITTLTLNCHADGYLNCAINGTTSLGTLELNGVSSTRKVFLYSSTLGTSRSLSVSTVTGQYVDIQDISMACDLSAITGGSGDCGGNSSITFTSPTTQHWVPSGDGSGNWGDVANWTSRVPLPQDDVIMDFAFGVSQIVTIDVPRLAKSIDWTGATFTTSLIWSSSAAHSMYGSLTLVDGMNSNNNTLTLSGRSSFTLTTGSSQTIHIIINAPSGTYTLGGDLKLVESRTLTLTTGTLTCGTYGITAGSFTMGGGTLNLGSATHTMLANGTVWNAAGTVNAETSTIKMTDSSNNALTFQGGTKTYNVVWFDRGASTGSITISNNNTFGEFKDTGTAAHSILFTTGTTQTFSSFVVRGNPGALITINSTTTGTHALIMSNTGPTIQTDYLNIQHSVVTPTNIWFAGNNSINNQSVTTAGSGWLFCNKATFRQPIRPGQFKPGFAR